MLSRQAIYEALENPATPTQKAISYGLLFVILLSIAALVIEGRFPHLAANLRGWLVALEYLILLVFGIEYVVRLAVSPVPWRYATSAGGIIDLLALLPSIVSLMLPAVPSITWLRAFRLLRFLRVLKLAEHGIRSNTVWSGILARVGPFIGVALAFKAVALSFEADDWWPKLDDLRTMLAVVGFALGVLLATKLGSAQRRMHEIEVSVCHVVGALRAVRHAAPANLGLEDWSRSLERALSTGEGRHDLGRRTEKLASALVEVGVAAPYVLALQQQAAFLANRVSSKTPVAYDRFLRYATLVYAVAVIIVMPGLVGFLSIALVVYVLGGMYFLIEDMDRPIDHHREALVDADLSPLVELNRGWETLARRDAAGSVAAGE